MMLMYSGNHLEEMEVDQMGSTRIVGGIHPDGFSWLLQPGEAFQTPEAIMSFSAEGLNGLSGNLHDLIRCRVVPKRFQHRRRPVLLNSWEAVYFDFNAVKLLEMGRNARELGIEMLVLDDGWFGKREADTSGLGDWQTNEKKLGCSLGELSDRLHEMGLGFGLWIEPEMISEDSDLYRSHPDWALADPDRNAVMSREQLVLDMARTDVQDYLYDVIALLLEQAKIEYLKWDFNRSVANVYSRSLPPEKQGEVGHRFVLGTYRLLERLTAAYPEVLIEGCAGGGGRFDAGMLFYCPQIWCSDNTDAVERLEIQRGTSYGYPICTMGAHVSSIPNHQTGRVIPLETRALVAGAGTFGYELNPKLLTEEEKRQIRQQIQEYHRYAALVEEGRYYRLTELDDSGEIEAWMFVSPNRREALVGAVCRHVRANGPFPWFRLEGLKPETIYRLQGNGKEYSGTALMYAGISFPLPWGDYAAWQLHFQAVE